MKNRDKSIQVYKKEKRKSNPFDNLEPIYQEAIQYKLEFYKYKYIARELKVKEQTVCSWFEKGGICQEAYDWVLEQRAIENESMINRVRKELEDLTPEAILVIKKSLSKSDAETAFKVLGINGISPIDKIEIDVNNKQQLDKFKNVLQELTSYVKPEIDTNHSKGSSSI